VAPTAPGLFWRIDGKPLPSGGAKDRQAGYGRAAAGKAKGYKRHALVGSEGAIAGWRLAPMNQDARVLAARLLKAAPPAVVGDVAAAANHDATTLPRLCDARGDLQLVRRRRCGPGKGPGQREQTAGRLRSIAWTESPFPAFAAQLLKDRAEVEGQFGNLTNWGGGLQGLPAWVQAKLVLTRLKQKVGLTTCAA
jgi:hypothetical protein